MDERGHLCERTSQSFCKRRMFAGLLIAILAWITILPISATEGIEVEMPKEFDSVTEALPEEIVSELPDGMQSENTADQAAALSEMLTPQYLFDMLARRLQGAIGQGSRLFFLVCGLLILSAVFQTVCSSFSLNSLRHTVRFCTAGGLFAALLYIQYEQLTAVIQCFERLHVLMQAMLPVGGVLLAMGGNVTTAAAGNVTLGVFLSVSETLCAKTVIPVCTIGTTMSVCQILSPEVGLRGVTNALRKTYTVVLGFVMTLLCFLLSTQSAFCTAADSAGARTAKLVSSITIPVVGGSVGDTLRVVAGSVQYLKSIVGVSGIFFVLLLVLPTFLSLVVTRLVFLIGSGMAEMMGCEVEGKLLSELGGVWGTLIAVVAMCAVMFILALVIFVRIAVAVG